MEDNLLLIIFFRVQHTQHIRLIVAEVESGSWMTAKWWKHEEKYIPNSFDFACQKEPNIEVCNLAVV